MTRPLALVTGASSGIGREIARLHARRGGDVIVVARRAEALEALATDLRGQGASADVVVADLAAPEGVDAVMEGLGGRVPDLLVNNAGLGGHGAFLERDLAADLAMIDLNVKALVALTHRVGAGMAARGSGRILQVGSTAGFMPGPWQATYFATKAFVNSFSQAVDEEMRPLGVTCTVLAPGYVETEFADAAGLRGTKLAAQKGATAEATARASYDAAMRGDLVAFNDPRLRFILGWVTPFVPRRTLLRMVRGMQAT